MSPDRNQASPARNRLLWLERATALVVLLVQISLVWMVTVAYQPQWLRVFSPDVEVILTVVLLIAALGLVSLVALLHTRA
jgi:hypothetical protein